MESNQNRDVNDRIPPPPPLEIVPSSPSGSGATTWNSALPNTKIDPPHKGVTTTTTADGKPQGELDSCSWGITLFVLSTIWLSKFDVVLWKKFSFRGLEKFFRFFEDFFRTLLPICKRNIVVGFVITSAKNKRSIQKELVV